MEVVKTEKSRRKFVIWSIVTGSVAGFVNGLFGGGGGMLVVPMLIFTLKYKPNIAHATAILIILPLSVLSSLFYSSFGILKLDVALFVTLGVGLGGILGAFLLSKLSNKILVIIFSLVMILAGGKMLFF